MHAEVDLIVDRSCEIYRLLQPWCVESFWDLTTCDIRTDRIYVIGRKQFAENKIYIRDLAGKGVRLVFANPFEGSETLGQQIKRLDMQDLFFSHKLLLISGGDMPSEWPYLLHDHFLSKIHDFDENIAAINQSGEIWSKHQKPYSFLFLNGRGRAHRKWMIERLDHDGLLAHSLHSWLDPSSGARRGLQLNVNGEDLMTRQRNLCLLPKAYEIERYRMRLDVSEHTIFAKYELFNYEWGEIYLHAQQYTDTYFSLVTETVHEWPCSFRTEKIWKPIAMGHPWIAVANQGFYRDIQDLGFHTFGDIIDESFDAIEDAAERLDRVAMLVKDICKSGPLEFMLACQDICKYNQQHLLSLRQPVLDQFPGKFFTFLASHQWTI